MKAKLFLCILSALVVAVIVTIGFGMIPMETVIEKTALIVLVGTWAGVFGAVVAKRYPVNCFLVGIFTFLILLFPYFWGCNGLPVQLLIGCALSVVLLSGFYYALKSKPLKDETLGGKLVVIGCLGVIFCLTGITIISWLFAFLLGVEFPKWILYCGEWGFLGVYFCGLIKRLYELIKYQE